MASDSGADAFVNKQVIAGTSASSDRGFSSVGGFSGGSLSRLPFGSHHSSA